MYSGEEHCLECDGNGYHVDDCPNHPNIHARRLKAAQEHENNGEGVQCVKVMLNFLERGQVSLAKAVWVTDGDKIRSYPVVEQLCKEIFGCRLHSIKNCPKCVAVWP